MLHSNILALDITVFEVVKCALNRTKATRVNMKEPLIPKNNPMNFDVTIFKILNS